MTKETAIEKTERRPEGFLARQRARKEARAKRRGAQREQPE